MPQCLHGYFFSPLSPISPSPLETRLRAHCIMRKLSHGCKSKEFRFHSIFSFHVFTVVSRCMRFSCPNLHLICRIFWYKNCIFLFLVTVAQFLCLLYFRTRIHYLFFSYYGIIRRSMHLTRVADVLDVPVYSIQRKDQRKLHRMNRNKNERRRRYKISQKSCSLKFFVTQTSIKVGEVLYE